MGRCARWRSLDGAVPLALAIALIWAALGGCTGGGSPTLPDRALDASPVANRTPWPRQSLPTVDLHADGRVEGGRLSISGVATVPDGALIAIQVAESPSGAILASTTTEVEAGTFALTIDVTGRGPQFHVWVAFQDYLVNVRQPEHVRAIYGDRFEYLAGENVYRTRERTGVAVQFIVSGDGEGR